MKELIKSMLRLIGGRDVLIFLTITFAFYAVVEKTGIFRVEPSSMRQVFHSVPVKIFSILIALNALTGMVFTALNREIKRKAGFILFSLSLVFLTAGIWVSAQTCFEGRTQIVEDNSFTAFPTQYIKETLYMMENAKMPQVGLTVTDIRPELSGEKDKLKEVTAGVLYTSRTTDKIHRGTLSSKWPLITDWTLVRIADFGYSVHYILMDLGEKQLENREVNMKLFPPGAEEFFDVMFMGYMFHVRLYPDYVDNDGRPDSVSAYPENPVFNLRIVRNKDIVFNGLLEPTNKLRFDNNVITLPGVKMWIEVELVRDLGLPIAAAGMFLMVIGAVLMGRKKNNQ
jgi:hypothetical protein